MHLEVFAIKSLRGKGITATSRLYTTSALTNLYNPCHWHFLLLLCFKIWTLLCGFETKTIPRSRV